MNGLDWGGLIRAGLRGLGLTPAEFWALTPAELSLMLGAEAASPPLTRARLMELAARWPDRPAARGKGDGNDGVDRRVGRAEPAGGGS